MTPDDDDDDDDDVEETTPVEEEDMTPERAAAPETQGLPKGAVRAANPDPERAEQLVALLRETRARSFTLDRSRPDPLLPAIALRVTALHAALGDTCRLAAPPSPIIGVAGDGTSGLIRTCGHAPNENNGPHRWDASGQQIG